MGTKYPGFKSVLSADFFAHTPTSPPTESVKRSDLYLSDDESSSDSASQDLQGNIPVIIRNTPAKIHDVSPYTCSWLLSKAIKARSEPLYDFTDSQRVAVRENAHFAGTIC